MGWQDKLRELAQVPPLRCPKGWGDVAFRCDVETCMAFFYVNLTRKCPIGGVATCAECEYAVNPQALPDLRQSLEDLAQLRKEGVITAEEYELRRRALAACRLGGKVPSPGRGERVAAWILGPMGVVIALTGVAFAMSRHPGFWAVAVGGAVMVALSLSFAMLARSARQPRADSRPADD